PPGPVAVPFRLPPDLLFWPRTVAPLELRYRYPMGPWINREESRLDVSLNGQYLRSFRLTVSRGPTTCAAACSAGSS
ncbi:MAG TPA: cellulose biosynthesis cyclic di-GMP-binding regulatory protein BcsB, partial [Phenylobacterium sp.]|nr:cellulose biosynthesis cyclic di-GMP-binding regulatory protein BcsB [Phenylobacterium sp.]